MNEWQFQGLVLNWIFDILRRRSELPFRISEQEVKVPRDRRRADITLYDQKGSVACIFELKLPDRPDGISPYNADVVTLTQQKANELGAPYFVTWNVNDAVLWKTFKPGVPILHRSVKPYLNITSIRQSEQIRQAHVRDALQSFLTDFIVYFGDVYTEKILPSLLPLDEGFIHTLQTYLQPVVQILTSDLMRRYLKDKGVAKELRDWAVEGQGWTWEGSSHSLPWELERTARLASNILVNKIVFYEAMRKAYPGLPILSVPTTVNTGAELGQLLDRHFERIRDDIDYETVFTEEFIDTIPFIADSLVEPLRQMIANVEGYDFAHLPYDVIGTIFQRLIAPDERHKLGQYFTPANEVDLINAFCIRRPDVKVLDPGCGAGSFLVRAYSRIKYLNPNKSHDELLDVLWGIDIARYPAHLAVLNLAVRDLSPDGNYPNIIREDFFNVFAERTMLLHRRRTYAAVGRASEEFQRSVPLMDVVVGNPPYTSQVEMEDLFPGLKERAHNALYLDWKVEISMRASIYAHFFIHGAAFLKEGGYLGLVTSNSWLDVDYGKHLQEFFLNNFKIVAILEPKLERWFPDAAVNTDITILQRCSDKDKRDANLVKFVQIKVPLAQLIPQTADEEARQKALDNLVQEIEAVTHHVDNDLWRIYPISQKELLQEGLDVGEGLVPSRREATRASSTKAVYMGAKWGKYLRAPEVFFQILERGKDRLCRLSDVAEVRFGIKTGANDFFYVKDITDSLSDAELKQLYGLTRKKAENIRVVEAGDGSTHLIEAEYLKPVIKSPREIEGITVDPSILQYQILMVHGDKRELRGQKVLDYIRWGEDRAYHRRPTCTSRIRWYDLGLWAVPDMLWSDAYNERFACFVNIPDHFGDKRFFFINFFHRAFDSVAAYLNSSILPLFIELEGIVSLGEGAVYTNVYQLKALPVLAQRRLDASTSKRLQVAFNRLKDRTLLSIFDEVSQSDRQELDGVVLEALGFTDVEERKKVQEALYEAVTGLVRTRLDKAQSVRAEESARRRASAEAIAEDLLQEFDPAMVKSFPKDFTPRKYAHTVIALPPDAHDFERLTLNRLRVGEKLLEFDRPDEALFVRYALECGAKESVLLPTHEPTLQKAIREYAQYLYDLDKYLTDLASSRTRDRKLKARIKDALRQKLRLPAAPEQQMRLL
jgi:hypothetical protein